MSSKSKENDLRSRSESVPSQLAGRGRNGFPADDGWERKTVARAWCSCA